MATFKFEIDCDNDAFGDDCDTARREIARILCELGMSLADDDLHPNSAQWVRDINGNRIGTYKYEDRAALRLGK